MGRLRRLPIKDLTAVVDELLERATYELWVSVEWPEQLQRESEREARGYWWGAFILALEMNAWPPGPAPHFCSEWVCTVRDAARSVSKHSLVIEAAS